MSRWRARLGEELGFRELWLAEDYFFTGGIAGATAATSFMRMSPGVCGSNERRGAAAGDSRDDLFGEAAMGVVVGIDVGGTNVRLALFEETGGKLVARGDVLDRANELLHESVGPGFPRHGGLTILAALAV